MSFTVTKEVKELISYPELGASFEHTLVVKNITYSAKRVVGFSESGAQVLFEVKVGGAENTGEYYHLFIYSGSGNPLEEAEASLAAELNG
ncbi:hypothetical protein MXU14_00635 [Klebsiella pneumoniae]|nr:MULTISPECIES: hypothetical protein [Klebsiella]HDU4102083.1 hypothetical protein [Klebsiella pneumoniae subsp. pneumoniae]HEP0714763.1 hypothetical protein [Klebsiella pneumoniae subsp. ozaenae]EKZ9872575.1 hypothetical protein [Klebsiella pneumoniae]ELA0419857.1 hypothetical protein [Klebsiella pneumoniae]MBA1590465.1 hypothetical protein [Klebsiella pneumoniae]